MMSGINKHFVKLLNSKRGMLSIKRSLSCQERLPKVTIDAEGKTAEVIVPGYSYEHLDRLVVGNVTKVLETITKCRHLTWDSDFLQMNSKLRREGMTFITGVRLSVPEICREKVRLIEEISKTDPQVHFIISLGNVGNSSFETNGSIKVVHQLQDESCVVNYNLFWVYIDRASRRVSKLPIWFVEDNLVYCNADKSSRIEIKDYISTVNQSSGENRVGVEKVHEKSFVISEKHIDKFQHTNHEVYVEYIMEVIQEYLTKSGRSQGDVKTFEVLYRGESNVGDALRVQLWQDGSQFMAYVVNSGKVIVLCRLSVQDAEDEYVKSRL